LKIAYLILCHKEPDQVARLVRRLDTAGAFFIIHVDRRSFPVKLRLESLLGEFQNVSFTKQYRCYWGSFNIVRATLACIREALKKEFDYAALLSGQDYPLKSNVKIRQFLSNKSNQEFIESFSLSKPNAWTSQGGHYNALYRASGFAIPLRSKLFHTKWLRKFPLNFEPYGGSQWWCLSRGTLEYVVQFIEDNPSFYRYFMFSFIPDEIFFQSILSNSGYASRIMSRITYVDWSNPHPPYPKILDESDLASLQEQDWLFGRKFDPVKSAALIGMLETD
jgi:hypothetical protein